MGKGAKPPTPTPPPPPVVANAPGTQAGAEILRKRARDMGLNYADTIAGGAMTTSKSKLGQNSLLGRQA